MTGGVVIIGGGLVGLASAWRLAEAGAPVRVLDPEPGRGASNVAAGMLAPVTEVTYGEEDRLALNIAAARRWPRFAAELTEATGIDVGYRPTGTLLVGFDHDDAATIADLHAFQSELGLQVKHLNRREAREREPMLSPRIRVGLLAGEDHRADPRAVVAALLQAATAAGVHLDRRRAVRIVFDDDRVTGVATSDGEVLPSSQVVLAAGAWSATLDGLQHTARPPVRPLKGQLLHLRDPGGEQVLATTVRGLVRGRSIYLVPRDDGGLVVGASEEERGFDTAVTAGALRELLDDGARIVPGVDELELRETIAGLRPTTPDNAPVIGHGGLDGLVLATGHHRNGVLLTPITAEAVAGYVTGGTVDPVMTAAAPDRPALKTGGPRRPLPDTGLDRLIAANRDPRGGR